MKLRDFDTKRSYLFLSSIFEEIKELDKIIHDTYRDLATANKVYVGMQNGALVKFTTTAYP